MIGSSIHTHTVFCDGKDDVETMCAAAWKKGFASIGFSAHAPVEKAGMRTDWHLPQARYAEYADAVVSAKKRWEGKLAVYLGLEVDYIRGRMGPADKEYHMGELDYLIGSVHYVLPPDNGEPFAVDGPMEEFASGLKKRFAGDGEALMAAYWEAEAEMVRAGGFDVLGHLDLVKKNNGGDMWFSASGENYCQKSAALIEPIAYSGVVVEVNTGGLNRGAIAETYPSPRLLSLLRCQGVPVTVTSDAHETSHLGGHYAAARRTLREAGYTTAVLFEGRDGDKAVWREEAL
jgi:histidinol-phosphatase (PHP family)